MITAAIAIPATHPLVTSPVAIFLIVLLIIVLAPVLLSRLKIPHVMGMILAGVLVGPYGFNLLARDMSFEVFGQVGLLYLMFLAGIEIDMYHLKKNIKRGVVFGLYTFAIPLTLGALAVWSLLHLDMVVALLLASMFAAHTLIAYPIVSRYRLTKHPAVIIAIAGTIITVLLSLVTLAAMVGIARSGEVSLESIGRLLLYLLGFCLLTIYLYPRITRWFFKRFNDPILQFVYILAMVFLAAQSALFTGIEGVFGAFFAGLVLNRYVPQRSSLMGRLEFVGNAIFIPYFLIGIGMLINVKVLVQGWETIYVAAVMTVVAMAGKWLAALATQLTFRMGRLDRSIIYQLSNAHTAVALAVVMIGLNTGLFNETILNGAVIMILITCTVSSIGTSRTASRLSILAMSEEPTQVSERDKRNSNVLIPIDNPLTATELVTLASMMRNPRRQRSRLFALHVRNDNSASARAIGRNAIDVAEMTASSLDTRLESINRFDLNFVTGVLNAIEERDINEVIIGLHRQNKVIDSFFGDKLTQLLRATHHMVIISRSFIPISTMTRIVVMVPDKAQFETGFSLWVERLANLAGQIGCRIIFCCYASTKEVIKTVITMGGYGIRAEFRNINEWDDFILLSNKILDDDLFVVINSRRESVSFTSEMDMLPDFLKRYFSQNNLMVIYPEQSGSEAHVPTMAENMSADFTSAPSAIWIHLMNFYRSAVNLRKRITHRHHNGRNNKIEL